MSAIAGELELENEAEFEQELQQELSHELEHEQEHEQEQEHEAFFNHLSAMADRGGRSQALRRIALTAARAALRADPRRFPVVEGELETEGELEAAGELELEATPSEREHFAAMMEHTGHAAAEAANEQEAAEHFLPLIGLAAKFVAPKLLGFAAKKIGGRLIGRVGSQLARRAGSQLIRRVAPRVLGRVAPRLTRGIANVTRTLYRNPSTRPLLHAVPRIARGTMHTLVRRVARGRAVTPQYAVRTLARNTLRTLANPRILNRTYRRSLLWDRRFHRYGHRYLGRPVGPYVRAGVTPPRVFSGGLPGVVPGVAPVVAGMVPNGVPYTGQFICRCTGRPLRVTGVAAVCPTCGR